MRRERWLDTKGGATPSAIARSAPAPSAIPGRGHPLAPPELPGAGQRAVPARAIEPSSRAAVWSLSAPAGAARWVERRPRVAGECPSNVPVSLSCG